MSVMSSLNLPPVNNNDHLSLQEIRSSHEAREAAGEKINYRKVNLLNLIYHYLKNEGYANTTKSLVAESKVDFNMYHICDNIDLDTVIIDYMTFYRVKFGKEPNFVKKVSSSSIRNNLQTKNYNNDQDVRKRIKKPIKPKKTKIKIQDDKLKSIRTDGMSLRASANVNYNNCEQSSEDNNNRQSEDANCNILKAGNVFEGQTEEWKDLARIISKDIYLHNPKISWDSIIGLSDAKRAIKESVIYPIKYPQLFTGILSPWKALLFYGPPGTGKTMLAKAVATECKTTFFNISASTLISKWRGDSEKLIRVLFDLARHYSPSTIFIDELDALMCQRGSTSCEHEGSKRMKTELLIQLDGISKTDDLVFLVAASNLPWELDQAMLRRFEKRIMVDLPTEDGRKQMFEKFLPIKTISSVKSGSANWISSDLDYDSLAKETQGYSGSDIYLVCKEAAIRPIRKIFSALETPSITGNLKQMIMPVFTQDVLEAIKHIKPTALKFRTKYDNWMRDYECL